MAIYLRNLGITQVAGGYSVVGYVTYDMGETFEGVQHPAVFRTRDKAEQFSKSLIGKSVDLSRWIVQGGDSSYYLQRDPNENPGLYSPVRPSMRGV
jgi:hypothetical protein